MESDFVCQGRSISTAELDWLRHAVAIHADWSRKRLAREICQRWQWRTAQGRLKDFAARSLLLKLQTRGLVVLPPLRNTRLGGGNPVRHPASLLQWPQGLRGLWTDCNPCGGASS